MMKKMILSVLTLLVTAMGVQAKSWNVGPSQVPGMDFSTLDAAVAAATVGDTIYLDQHYSSSAAHITKRLVIIGTGYDTSLTDEKEVAQLTHKVYLEADGIEIKSVLLGYPCFSAENCVLDRCRVFQVSATKVIDGMNYIRSCYIFEGIDGKVSVSDYNGTTNYKSKLNIQNCVFDYKTDVSGNKTDDGYGVIRNLQSSIINNNTILYENTYKSSSSSYYSPCLNYLTNCQITNNIVMSKNSTATTSCVANSTSCTIEHNIMSTVPSSYTASNKEYTYSNILSFFTQSGNFSDYYKLNTAKAGNPALNYATDGGEVGCHGGMYGCPSSGRPKYVPYFTKVTVGQRSENGKLPVNVSVKIQNQ